MKEVRERERRLENRETINSFATFGAKFHETSRYSIKDDLNSEEKAKR